jgi:small subunit ribosomal protein S9
MAKKIENLALAVGRRKSAIARVYVRKGTGKVTVNHKPIEDYFSVEFNREWALQPLEVTDSLSMYDILVNVQGGGISGQAGAIRHAISRSLAELAEQNKKVLKANGMLTRDPRMVERKKYGQKKARKSFQFSKR